MERSDSTRHPCHIGGVLLRNPITGTAACCARATTGHAAALPSPAMNSRRRIHLSRLIDESWLGNDWPTPAQLLDDLVSGGLVFRDGQAEGRMAGATALPRKVMKLPDHSMTSREFAARFMNGDSAAPRPEGANRSKTQVCPWS